MSDLLYPLSLIERLSVEKFERTIADAFEDGSTSTRRLWAAQNFKRRFTVQHAPLTIAEWRYLRSFHSARHGRYDSFWFRDNVNRDGNAKVRFTGPLPSSFSGSARRVQLVFEEIAALRALPEREELTTAAGTAAGLWYDANREVYYAHAGTVTNGDGAYWDEMGSNRLTPPPGYGMNVAGADTGQYSSYATGTLKSIARGAVSGLTALPYTLFCVKTDSHAPFLQCWFGYGAAAGNGFGLHTDAAGETYCGLTGGTKIASLGTTIGSGTWASFAIVATATAISLYCNGALVATNAQANTFTSGLASVFCDPSFTSGAFAGNLNHLMVFPAALTLAQIKAVHNLIGYQHGLSIVV